MLANPKKKKVEPKTDRRGREIRPHIVARGKLLAQDPNYPDRKILRQTARKFTAENSLNK